MTLTYDLFLLLPRFLLQIALFLTPSSHLHDRLLLSIDNASQFRYHLLLLSHTSLAFDHTVGLLAVLILQRDDCTVQLTDLTLELRLLRLQTTHSVAQSILSERRFRSLHSPSIQPSTC